MVRSLEYFKGVFKQMFGWMETIAWLMLYFKGSSWCNKSIVFDLLTITGAFKYYLKKKETGQSWKTISGKCCKEKIEWN